MADETTGAPPAWYAWYAVAVLTLANISAFIDQGILSYLVEPIKRDLHVTDAQFSYLSGLAFAVFYSVLGFPIARLADRSNRRNLMAGGIGLWSMFTSLCAVAQSYGALFLLRVGVGVGEATLNAPSVSLLADYFPRERLGRAMSIFSLGIFLGSGVAYYLSGWIVGLVDVQPSMTLPLVGTIRAWQSVFLVVGLPGLVVALLLLTVREPLRRTTQSTPSSFADLWRYVSANRRTFLTYGLGFTASGLVNWSLAVWFAQFLVRTYGWKASDAGRVQGLLTMTIGTASVLAGGWLTDWFVRRGKLDGPLRVGMIGAAGMLVSATAAYTSSTSTRAVVWLAVVNVFAALPWGAAATAAAEVVPAPLRAQAAALFFLVQGLIGRVLGPSSVAWITQYVFHDDRALRYSLAIVNVAGMLTALALFAAGLGAYRRTLAYRESWMP
jgi:MFS family permease